MPIKIVAKKEGFRRAGTAHSGTKIYPDDHFTGGQLTALKSEPNLEVSEVAAIPAKAEDEKPGEKPKGKK